MVGQARKLIHQRRFRPACTLGIDLGIETGFFIFFKKVKTIILGIVKFGYQTFPIGSEFLAFVNDIFNLFIGYTMTGDVSARHAHALADCIHLGRFQEHSRFAFVVGLLLFGQLG